MRLDGVIFMTEPIVRRRRFLGVWTASLLAVLGGLIVAPAVAFITSPLRKRLNPAESGFADAGAVDGLVMGQWALLPIEILRQDGWSKEHQRRSVWVLREGAGERDIKVLSPICTHLGCPISLSPDSSKFQCPCHGGVYGHDGAVTGGPPPRGMDPLEFEIRAGHLWVRWQDFKISVAERIAVQV